MFFFKRRDANSKKYTSRTPGRGMIYLDMGDYDSALDLAAFVRTYQKKSKLLIGNLKEIAYK